MKLGDDVLEVVAKAIREKSRAYDCIGRWSGDEFVLALPGVIAPGPFDASVLTADFPMMIGITVLLLVLARGFRNQRSLTRPHGVLLLMLFVAYYVYLFSQQQG